VKTRLAVIGPRDSVALICEVAQERNSELQVLPVVYQDASEVPGLIDKYDNDVDVWLFSGKVPYVYAVQSQKSSKPLHYIPHTGSSVYRVLLQMARKGQVEINKISFDTFNRKEIEETFADISVPIPEIYVNNYEGLVTADELTRYHYDLWKNGNTTTAVTCFYSSYLKLQELGVPVFRIWPTRDNIRTLLDVALSKAEASRYKDGQIAIQHIAIERYEDFVRESASSYQVMRLELQLYELLVQYTETIRGTIVIHGNGQYTIYSTRGIIATVTKEFTVMPLLEEITKNLNVKVIGGIGFGQTAYSADESAHIALGLARTAGSGKWMVVLDDRTVIGPLSSPSHLQYCIRTDDQATIKLAEMLNISIRTLNKLFAAFEKVDNQTIGAEELALNLAITTRSARRLLGKLLSEGFAEIAGEEVPVKGRPRKLYRILLDKLLISHNNS